MPTGISVITAKPGCCAYCRHQGDGTILEAFNMRGQLACRDMAACTARRAGLEPRHVNEAAWRPPVDVPDGWAVASAPRPIPGDITWQDGGVFYAAAPGIPAGDCGWAINGAALVLLISNEAIENRVRRMLDGDGSTPEDWGVPVAEIAAMLGLPWYQEAAP